MKTHATPQSIPAGLETTVPDPVLATVSVRTPLKVAVTVFAASIATVHAFVSPTGVQLADHPRKIEPEAGEAVSVTAEPTAKGAEHVEPHEMPVGDEATVPEPELRLALDTVRVAADEKDAVTLLAAFIATVQVVPVPAQSPDQPVNTDPVAREAVRVTEVPAGYDFEQLEPHEMPDGFDVTVPAPVPDLVTVSR